MLSILKDQEVLNNRKSVLQNPRLKNWLNCYRHLRIHRIENKNISKNN
jgi:hypothetical protein